ncbi:hypothetical protein JCM10212_000409 [Sporobolomyces blumeae]
MSQSALVDPFSALTFHSAGSPAPWQTSPSALPLHLRTLVSAVLSLSTALSESEDQLRILRQLVDRAHALHHDLRRAVAAARDSVLRTSQQAQHAHAEAKRVDTLEAVFRKGADRTMSSLDRTILRSLRKGKMRAYPRTGPQDDVCPVLARQAEDEFDPFNFVEELLVDLDLDLADLTDPTAASSQLELDDEWLEMQDELVARLATKARDRGSPTSPRRTSLLWGRRRRGSRGGGGGGDQGGNESTGFTVSGGESDGATTDGDVDDAVSDAGSDHISSPSTPPSSIHSFDDSSEDPDSTTGDRPPRPPTPDYDVLVEVLTPLVHPVLLLLYRLRHLLASRLTSAIDAFETLVRASAEAVAQHRDAVQRLNKNAAKLRDLMDLERREVDEEERLEGELRGVVVELAKVRKLPYRSVDEPVAEEDDDVQDSDDEEVREADEQET